MAEYEQTQVQTDDERVDPRDRPVADMQTPPPAGPTADEDSATESERQQQERRMAVENEADQDAARRESIEREQAQRDEAAREEARGDDAERLPAADAEGREAPDAAMVQAPADEVVDRGDERVAAPATEGPATMTAPDRTEAEPLSPGDMQAPAVPDVWPADVMTALRERWREVQLHFVDDPHGAAAEADALLSEAVQTLTSSLDSRRSDLAGWRGDGAEDTERLRLAVQRYRGFLDRLLGL